MASPRKKRVQKAHSDTEGYDELRANYANLLKKYGLKQDQLIGLTQELFGILAEDIQIPVSIFKTSSGPLEGLVSYLRKTGVKNKRIAELLDRSEKTISQAYDAKIVFDESSKHTIPLSKFSDRRYSVLESLVTYLKEESELSYREISELIGRDQRTIWTVHSRAKKKRGEANG